MINPYYNTTVESMTANNRADDDSTEIETSLTFDDIGDYPDHEPLERVAEAVIEQGDRKVYYLYDLVTGGDRAGEEDELQVHARYFLDGELRHGSSAQQTYPTDGERVFHTETGQELREFIEANAFADPEISITDEFESVVEVSD